MTTLAVKSSPFSAADTSAVTLARIAFQATGHLPPQLMQFLKWARRPVPEITLHEVMQTKGSATFQAIAPTDFPAKAVIIVLQALKAILKSHKIDTLHAIVNSTQTKLCQGIETEEGAQLAYLFLLNQVGLRTIQIILPRPYALLACLVQRFYLDDLHPMDLQKHLRNKTTAPQVGHVMRNLVQIERKSCPLVSHFAFLEPESFNSFLTVYIHAIRMRASMGTLLNISSINLNLPKLQTAQEKYFLALGVSKEELDQELQFSTPEKGKGIFLYPLGESGTEGQVCLQVPDAGGRTVAISKAGFKILEKLQIQMTIHLYHLIQKLQKLFPEHTITGRVKSARSMLDKCGRVCHQKKGITEIVDGCGLRITCKSSSQIYEVIHILQAEFEFLELDNKYANIRKDGAYKAIPCTLLDRSTSLVFELQIVTLTATIVSDLNHNVIYKRNAVGLNPSQEETQAIISLQRFAALTETASLTSSPIALTEKLKSEKMQAAQQMLQEMCLTALKHKREMAKL
jgi:ppGpp synthetase/RelA/SpoT-type nucleotidyltranferase